MTKLLKIMIMLGLCMQIVSVQAFAAESSNNADVELIKAACMDYVEGFYQSDGERMKRSVHPSLVKRNIIGESIIEDSSREELIKVATSQKWKMTNIVVDVYDIGYGIALAKVTSDYDDYVELAKIDGRWQVVNVLWARAKKHPISE